MQDLAGKRVIIGGGATGMGAGLALRLVRLGANVVVGDRNAAGLKALEPKLAEGPGRAVTMVFDLMDDAGIEALVQRCVDEFGGVDKLAIPAADTSAETMMGDEPVTSMDPKVWERVMRINVIGHGLLMKAAIPHMVKAGGGSIVVISSEASFLGMSYVPAYSSSKAALQALVRHTARIVGKDNIRVNGVCPGRVIDDGREEGPTRPEVVGQPPRNALQRHGKPDDVARVIAFLLSDESGWISGQTISANGGSDMRD
ncbi:SDR family NAD(P)-dependent oxidoreductase [Novosphingobium bradum]|uniref:SDR family NAD(P)-dependent oxidoreductase n=1 Tax=Novosphingobium bradum TaxID=1737444 RepID=A0ABV7IPC2_9SPHN